VNPSLNTFEKTGLNGCPAAMGSRKRTHSEVAPVAEQQVPEEPGLLSLRSNWAFASLMQYIAIFGQVMKIDEEFGIEVCLASIVWDKINAALRVALMKGYKFAFT
jgi:hypothetical protein